MFWNRNSKSSTFTDELKNIIKKDTSFQYEKNGICISWEICGLQYGTLNGKEIVLDKDIINSLCSDITDSFCRNNSKYFPKPSNVHIQINTKSMHSYNQIQKKNSLADSNNEKSPASSLFSVITPLVNVEDVYLDAATKNTIKDALAILKYRDILFKKWKLGGTNSSRSLVLNFYGPSGTGKTMMAEAIGNYLQKKVLFVDYSQLESRYVGDTPKNIKQAFNEAKAQDAIIVFDEADSFLGKRLTNVIQSADYGVNVARSVMLVELERFDGVVIFTTNLIKNYDDAFKRRILTSVEFKKPSIEGLMCLWKQYLSKDLPISDDVSINKLVNTFTGITGADIKDIILLAAIKALRNEGVQAKIKWEYLYDAAKTILSRYNVEKETMYVSSERISNEQYKKETGE